MAVPHSQHSELGLYPTGEVHPEAIERAALLLQSAQAVLGDAAGSSRAYDAQFLADHAQRLSERAYDILGKYGQDWHIGRAQGDRTQIELIQTDVLTGMQQVEYVRAIALTQNNPGERYGSETEVARTTLGETNIVSHHTQVAALREHEVVVREPLFAGARESTQQAFGQFGERLGGSELGRLAGAVVGALFGATVEAVGQHLQQHHGLHGREEHYFDASDTSHRAIQERAASLESGFQRQAARMTAEHPAFHEALGHVDQGAQSAMVAQAHEACRESEAAAAREEQRIYDSVAAETAAANHAAAAEFGYDY